MGKAKNPSPWTLKDAIDTAIKWANKEESDFEVVQCTKEKLFVVVPHGSKIERGEKWVAHASPGNMVSIDKGKKPTKWNTTRWMGLTNRMKGGVI